MEINNGVVGQNMPGAGAPPAPLPAQAPAPRMNYRGSVSFTDGLPSGQAWGQTPDGQRVAMNIPGARQPAGRDGPSGPIGGQGLDSSLLNILIEGDPSTPQYAAAFARIGAEEVMPNGSTRRPDMAPFRTPTYRPPAAGGGAGLAGDTQSGSTMPGAASGQPGATAAATPDPGPAGGRDYGRAETTSNPSSQAREAVRKAEGEVPGVAWSGKLWRAPRTPWASAWPCCTAKWIRTAPGGSPPA